MPNPLSSFVSEGRRLTDLVRSSDPLPEPQLVDFKTNQKRLEFLRDLIARVGVLAHCYDAICGLTERWNDLQARIHALPNEPGQPNTRTIPDELVGEEERWRVEVDAFTSLIYYEVTSIVGMLRQLSIVIDVALEVQFLVKVRDRFLSHVQLSGVMRGSRHAFSVPMRGFLERDVVALSSWFSEDLRALGKRALQLGSPAWEEQRRRNEELVLSKKGNEDFTQDELVGLMAAGVRECELELALHQLAELLNMQVVPLIVSEADKAILEFQWERWVDDSEDPASV